MDFDSVANVTTPSLPKDFGKKKRTSRLAKLKQCKLDARREQWLSQAAKNKGSKEELNGRGGSLPPFSPGNEGNPQLENPETGSRGDENEGLSLHDSDLDSLGTNSTRSADSRKDRPGSSCGSSSGSGCYSGNFSDDEEDDDCLDDWEAIADALTADDKHHHHFSVPSSEEEIRIRPNSPDAQPQLPDKYSEANISETGCKKMVPRVAPKSCAWSPDDTLRPQSLPNLSKQSSFIIHAEQQPTVHRWDKLPHNSRISQPLSCLICYEDLDPTDQNFQPCTCGFRVCLFCYKRIFEVGDGRCPGCRRPYDPADGNAVVNGGSQPVLNTRVRTYGLFRSCSTTKRSLGKVSH